MTGRAFDGNDASVHLRPAARHQLQSQRVDAVLDAEHALAELFRRVVGEHRHRALLSANNSYFR
ncbi:MAG: hypothetical protein ACRED5_19785 [Propylenella sp.]